MALPVDGKGIDDPEVGAQQPGQRDPAFVLAAPVRFGVPAVGASLLLARRPARAVGLSGFRPDHAVKLVKVFLDTPEAAARKIDGLHGILLFSPSGAPGFARKRVYTLRYRSITQADTAYMMPA